MAPKHIDITNTAHHDTSRYRTDSCVPWLTSDVKAYIQTSSTLFDNAVDQRCTVDWPFGHRKNLLALDTPSFRGGLITGSLVKVTAPFIQ